MSKQVLFTIRGLHNVIEQGREDAPIEFTSVADYYEKDGVRYIFYEEVTEGVDAPTKNRVKIDDHSVVLIKRGGIATELVFDKGKSCESTYMTPMGSITMTTDTTEFTLEETEERLICHLSYNLSMNYSPVAECQLELVVRPTE